MNLGNEQLYLTYLPTLSVPVKETSGRCFRQPEQLDDSRVQKDTH